MFYFEVGRYKKCIYNLDSKNFVIFLHKKYNEKKNNITYTAKNLMVTQANSQTNSQTDRFQMSAFT